MLGTVLSLSVLAFSQTNPESLRMLAESVFFSIPHIQAPPQDEGAVGRDELTIFLQTLVQKPQSAALSILKSPALYLRLDEVRNNYWRTAATFPLNSRTVTVGFAVSRGQDAYMSLLPQDAPEPTSWVNVKGLLDKEKQVELNGKRYDVSLSPNIFDKLGSKLKLKGNNEARTFKLRELIAASFDKGFSFPIGKQDYRVFFYDDLSDEGGFGRMNPAKKNVTMVLREGDDFHIYIISFEDVPSSQLAVYTLKDGARAGLQALEGGKVLAMYPNP